MQNDYNTNNINNQSNLALQNQTANTSMSVTPQRSSTPTQGRYHWIPVNFVPYKNYLPQTREYRVSLLDKESLEKSRLQQVQSKLKLQRRGGYHAYDINSAGSNIVKQIEGSAGHVTEADRFYTNFSEEEKNRRDLVNKSTEDNYDRRRIVRSEKEAERFQKMDNDAKKYTEETIYFRDNTGKARRNQSGVDYDLVTLQYKDQSKNKMEEDLNKMKERAKLRSDNLVVSYITL